MTAATTDLSETGKRVEAHLQSALGQAVQILTFQPLGGGACQDNYRVDASIESGPLAGQRRFVLRSDAGRSLPASIDRRVEFAVLEEAVARGVKTPRARFLASDLVREGASAYFLDWAPGEAIGRKIVREPALAAARAGLPNELAAELAKIHAITPETAPALAAVLTPPLGGALTGALTFMRTMIDAMPVPSPALELAMLWLEDHRPAAKPLTLVHGDFRTGNFLVTPEGLSAVLDWEFAHWGAPEEDLAWLCMRNWRFNELDKPVGGFAPRAALYEAYERATGVQVSAADVHYWEVVGNVRWAAGCVLQGERYLSGAEKDIELIAIPRHAAEMELEALRLIERGPSHA